MKYLFFFILAFGIPYMLISNDKLVGSRNVSLHFNPLLMFDYSPRYRIGFSYTTNNNLAYSLDFSYGNSVINSWRLNGLANGKHYSFFELRPEIQYFYKNTNKADLYVSSEAFFIKVNDVFENGEYSSNYYNTINYERADFAKTKYGIHLKSGFIAYFNERFFVDIYAGFGFANRTIAYTNIINPKELNEALFIEWLPQPQLFEGKKTLLHLTAGFKVAWIIWNPK